jgi:uncharacterized protein YcbK (DUF882 family)
MPSICQNAAFAAVVLCCSAAVADAQDVGSPSQFYQERSTQTAPPETAGAAESPAQPGKALRRITNRHGVARSGPAGAITRQIPSVSTACLKPGLMRIIHDASSHFGSAAVITSGYRPGKRSYHGKCMAADIQIAGVSPGTLARYLRGRPGVGGVGTYGHTRSVHVDIAERKYAWHGGRTWPRVIRSSRVAKL